MKKHIHFVLILLSFFLFNCKSQVPPVYPESVKKLFLNVEEITCTEAWVNLKAENITPPYEAILKIDTVSQQCKIFSADTVIIIDSLLPNKNYTIQLQLSYDTKVKSEALINTLDTTSHNFIWRTFEFGENDHSIIKDVAIISDNDIWAVGEIYMGGYLPDYNAAHWDGNTWTLKKISWKGIVAPLYQIVAFNSNDIWFDTYVHYDGMEFKEFPVTELQKHFVLREMWGRSFEDMYIATDSGRIIHYDGKDWTKIPSGTTNSISDIWGKPGSKIIWFCGFNSSNGNSSLFKIEDNNITKVYEGYFLDQNNGGTVGQFLSCWTNTDRFIYGINNECLYRQDNKSFLDMKRLTGNFDRNCYQVWGNNHNDIYISGSWGRLWHYNGLTCQYIQGMVNSQDRYYALDGKSSIIVAAGSKHLDASFSKAIITIITHN